MTEGDRLKEFAEKNFGSQAKLAAELGMTPQAMSSYVKGKRNVGFRLAEKLKEVGCDIDWLKTGVRKITAAERYFSKLTKEQIEEETAVIEGNQLSTRPHHIRFFHGSVGASLNNPSLDIEEDTIDIRELAVGSESAFALRVRGSSMLDAGIEHGDTIFISTDFVPENDDLLVVNVDGSLLVKRLKIYGDMRVLVSERGGYPDLLLNGDESVSVFGVVESILKDRKKRKPKQ